MRETRKQAVTRCCLLTSDSVWRTHLLSFYAFTMRCSWNITALSETWKLSARSPQVWMLLSSMAEFRALLSRTCELLRQSYSQRDRSLNMNCRNQCLAVSSHTALSPNAWSIRRRCCCGEAHFEVINSQPQTICFDMFPRHCSSYGWYVSAKDLNLSTAMPPNPTLSQYVMHLFVIISSYTM